jgi:hypothetical protein
VKLRSQDNSRAKLRLQLPLVLPSSPLFSVTVAGKSVEYALFQPLEFDDSYVHIVSSSTLTSTQSIPSSLRVTTIPFYSSGERILGISSALLAPQASMVVKIAWVKTVFIETRDVAARRETAPTALSSKPGAAKEFANKILLQDGAATASSDQ